MLGRVTVYLGGGWFSWSPPGARTQTADSWSDRISAELHQPDTDLINPIIFAQLHQDVLMIQTSHRLTGEGLKMGNHL